MGKILKLVPVLLSFLLPLHAQEESRPSQQRPVVINIQTEDAALSQGQVDNEKAHPSGWAQDMAIPIEYSPIGIEVASLGGSSFPGSIAWEKRNSIGFGLGATGGYYSNVDRQYDGSPASTMSSFSVNAFANLSRSEKVAFHFDYGTGYSLYNNRGGNNDFNHNGNVVFSYRISPKISINLSDQLDYSTNDGFDWAIFSPDSSGVSIIDPEGNLGSDIGEFVNFTLPSQWVLRNNATASVGMNLTDRMRVSGDIEYENVSYEIDAYADVQRVSASAGLTYAVTNWLSVGSGYTFAIVNDTEESRAHNVSISSFNFSITPNLVLSVAGGFGILEDDDEYSMNPSGSALLSWTNESSSIHAGYSMSMRKIFGYRIMPTNTVSAGFSRRITDRTNAQLNFSYERANDFKRSDQLLEAYTGKAKFGLAITSSLSASANYMYRHQNSDLETVFSIPQYEQSSFFGSLEYVWNHRY